MSLDVYFYEAFAEEAEALRRLLPTGLRAGFTARTVQEHGQAIPPARLLSIRTQSVLPASWARQIDGLQARATGYDHLLRYRDAATPPPALGALPKYCGQAVAEQAILLLLALWRKLPRQMTQFDHFDRDGLTGLECRGRTLLVVGVGDIGHRVTRLGRALGLRVQGVDIVRRHRDVRYTSLRAGLPAAEAIICAMNLTERNQGYFSEDVLCRARRGAVFVNVSRGELSPPPVLHRLLKSGHLGGVGLDVFADEPLLANALRAGRRPSGADHRAVLALRRMPQAILTPHNAFNTIESVERKAALSIEQVSHFLRTGRFRWPLPA